MDNVTNYEVMARVADDAGNPQESDLRLVGYEDVNAVNWLVSESEQPFSLSTDVGSQACFQFTSIDDAFRFRMQFDAAISPRG